MKRAIQLPQYSDMKPFTPPPGVTSYRIDKFTNQLADESCPTGNFTAAFLDGTQPQNYCSHMGESPSSLADKLYGDGTAGSSSGGTDSNGQPHRNFFQKMLGIGKKPDDGTQPPPPQPAAPPPPQ
jgi:penicillin-binding protein 1B